VRNYDLDMSVTMDQHHERNEIEEAILQETCVEVIEPTNLEFNDDILSIEYESFLCEFDDNESFDESFCTEYESFSFNPILAGLLFESHKSKFVESEAIVTEHFALDQTLVHIEFHRLVDFAPTILPRPLIHDDILSSPMTHRLASLNYICLFDV